MGSSAGHLFKGVLGQGGGRGREDISFVLFQQAPTLQLFQRTIKYYTCQSLLKKPCGDLLAGFSCLLTCTGKCRRTLLQQGKTFATGRVEEVSTLQHNLQERGVKAKTIALSCQSFSDPKVMTSYLSPATLLQRVVTREQLCTWHRILRLLSSSCRCAQLLRKEAFS